MYLFRGLLIWMAVMFAESVHGTIRQMFLAPLVGDLIARRIAFFSGMVLIFLITYVFIRWIGAGTVKSLLILGVMWGALTLLFEFGLGIFVFGYSREQMFEDYDISRGGLMGFGILFMAGAPLLAAKLRDKGKGSYRRNAI